GLLICGCMGLAACTASTPKGPDVAVSTPSVGRPQPPASAQAALSRMAFTPYAALGEADNDGLAPGASDFALASACMTAAGYPGSGNIPVSISLSQAGLSFGQPWGAWGYLGDAVAWPGTATASASRTRCSVRRSGSSTAAPTPARPPPSA